MKERPKFPEAFDYTFYISTYPEVACLNYADACRHFKTEGKALGYAGSPLADRGAFFSFLLSCDFQSILEIGPGVNPAFKGEHVSYFDVRRGEEFLEYARQKGVTD